MGTGTVISMVLIGVAALIVIATIWGLLSRYRRSAPDELLVVFGKAGKYKDENGKVIPTPSKIIQGGGAFVWPIIQDFKKMSMKPIQIKVNVDGIDSQAIPMHLPVVLTTAISQDKLIQQNAATRFLSANPTEVERQISEILVGETRAIMATMLIEEINADRNTFLGKVRESLEQELQKVGYELTNINISEITDDADYIKNMGKKAATKAKANAEADIAEQTKQGNVKIANTRKEEEIAVSQAERDKQISVNQAKQEQEVKVAEINREKEIKLAEADKERESGIALQEAERLLTLQRQMLMLNPKRLSMKPFRLKTLQRQKQMQKQRRMKQKHKSKYVLHKQSKHRKLRQLRLHKKRRQRLLSMNLINVSVRQNKTSWQVWQSKKQKLT